MVLQSAQSGDGGGFWDGFVNLTLIMAAMVLAFVFLAGRKQKDQLRDFWFFSWFFKYLGIDHHDPFDLTIVLQQVQFMTDTTECSCCLVIAAGRKQVFSKSFSSADSRLHETLYVKVEQSVRELTIALHQDTHEGARLAVKKVRIGAVLRLAEANSSRGDQFKKAIALRKKSKLLMNDAKVYLDFVIRGREALEGIEGIEVSNVSPEMLLQLQAATKKTKKKNKKHPEDASDESEGAVGQLEIIALTCEGKLRKAGNFGGFKECYFAVYQCNQDWLPEKFLISSKAALISWAFGWWESQEGYASGVAPVSAISMLRISNVFVVTEKPNDFCVRHVSKEMGKEELYLSCMDRSSAVWVESIHLFIEHLRAARSEVKEHQHAQKAQHVSGIKHHQGSASQHAPGQDDV